MMDSLMIRKDGRLRVGGTGRRVLKSARERVQRNFFRNCFWEVSLDLFGEPECGYWPQPQIGLAPWSLSTTGDQWQNPQTLMRLSVLPDEAVLRNPDWVPPVQFVLRLLRPLRWFGLLECRGEDATRTGHGEWRTTPPFDRFVQFRPICSGSSRSRCTDTGGGEGRIGFGDVADGTRAAGNRAVQESRRSGACATSTTRSVPFGRKER